MIVLRDPRVGALSAHSAALSRRALLLPVPLFPINDVHRSPALPLPETRALCTVRHYHLPYLSFFFELQDSYSWLLCLSLPWAVSDHLVHTGKPRPTLQVPASVAVSWLVIPKGCFQHQWTHFRNWVGSWVSCGFYNYSNRWHSGRQLCGRTTCRTGRGPELCSQLNTEDHKTFDLLIIKEEFISWCDNVQWSRNADGLWKKQMIGPWDGETDKADCILGTGGISICKRLSHHLNWIDSSRALKYSLAQFMNNWVNLQITDNSPRSPEFTQIHLLVCPQQCIFILNLACSPGSMLDSELDIILEIIQETLSTPRSSKASVK